MRKEKKALRTIMITRDLSIASKVYSAIVKLFSAANPEWVFSQETDKQYFCGKLVPYFNIYVELPLNLDYESIAHQLDIAASALAGVYREEGVNAFETPKQAALRRLKEEEYCEVKKIEQTGLPSKQKVQTRWAGDKR